MAVPVRRRGASARRGSPVGVSRFDLGGTQTSNSLDTWGDPTALANGVARVNECMPWRNQHIMYYGAGVDPWPNPAQAKDYSAIDYCVVTKMVGQAAPHINITLHAAPDWMKDGGVVNNINPALQNDAPNAANVTNFANLCAAIATRYTQVEAFHVWNEFKGMYDVPNNHPDYIRYTTLYNAVWSAVKTARPAAQVGGPYIVLSVVPTGTSECSGTWGMIDQRVLDAIKYWFQNKTGADFLAFDGGNMPANSTDQLVSAVQSARLVLPAFMAWLRGLNNTTYPGATTLPVVFAEYYIWAAHWNDAQPSHAQSAAVWAVGTMNTIRSGVTRAFLWEVDGDSAGDLSPYSPMALVTSTLNSGGGVATPQQVAAKALHDFFAPGRVLHNTKNTNANIETLGTDGHALLVNTTASSQTTANFTPASTLTAWEVRVVAWAP